MGRRSDGLDGYRVESEPGTEANCVLEFFDVLECIVGFDDKILSLWISNVFYFRTAEPLRRVSSRGRPATRALGPG